ncbi:MAG: hypothetical protein JXB32_18190 [Deltaproteobacteria bacterium]|nr:hypothetical protein [Deltaproteobacteria bacterium]
MELKQQITPTLEVGGTRVTATLQDPVVTLSPWDTDMPTLCIEEGAVVVELEFPDPACLARFQARLAAMHVPDQPTEIEPEGPGRAPARHRGKR